MDSRDLTPTQAERLLVVLRRHLSFLNRLQQRMEHLGFPPADPLYKAASEARNRTGELFVNVHYCSCAGGVGREMRRVPPAPTVPAAPEQHPGEPVINPDASHPLATTPVPPAAPA